MNLLRMRDRRTHKLELKRNIGEDKVDTREVAYLYVRVRMNRQTVDFPNGIRIKD